MAKEKFGKWEFSEEELEEKFNRANKRGKEELKSQPHAINVVFDKTSNMIFVYLINDSVFGFPTSLIKELNGATSYQISQVTLTPLGDALHWDNLNAHYTLVGLLNGVFGTKAWMQELGRKGGSVSSGAKASAARINGIKGGRPRKYVEHHLEVDCDFCGNSIYTKGNRTISPQLKTSSSLVSFNELEELFTYINEPIERRNRRIVGAPVSSNDERFQVLGRNSIKVLGLEN